MTLQTVHLRVNDAATGRPTPVRLRITDAVGAYCPPFGRPAEFAHGPHEDVGGNLLLHRDRWTYIDGTCEVAVPPGDITVEASKGPEYRPLRQTTFLPAGKMSLRLAIERWTDLRAEGWYSGDTRAHFLPPHAALLEAAAEDLAVVHLLARETYCASFDGQVYAAYPNLLAFSGQRPCLEGDGHQVIVGIYNRHPVLGSLGLLNCHRVVYPLAFGGADGTEDWSLADWCDQCHRKNGLVVWTDAFAPQPGHGGEALADAILGKIDALELDPVNPHLFRTWYQLLNAGCRLPLAGASGKISNRTPLGAMRTYAHLPDNTSFNLAAWVEAVRAGRTFVTAGQILRFTVDGQRPGAVIERPAAGPPLRVTVRAEGVGTFTRIELLENGEVVVGSHETIDLDHSVPASCWLAARCWGPGQILAHTSPIYVRVGGHAPRADPDAVSALDRHLRAARDWAAQEGRFTSDRSRAHLLGIFDAARQALLARSGPSGTIDAPAPPAPPGNDG